jgi:hypothetical protein
MKSYITLSLSLLLSLSIYILYLSLTMRRRRGVRAGVRGDHAEHGPAQPAGQEKDAEAGLHQE